MDKEEFRMNGKLAVIEAACGICSLPEEQLLERLEGLYYQGAEAGSQVLKPMVEDLAKELSRIIVARVTDPESVPSVIDDFCKRHVKFVQKINETKH